MAILVVLQTQASAGRIQSSSEQASVSKELDNLQFELSRLNRDIQELETRLRDQQEIVSTDDLSQIIERKTQWQEAVDKATEELRRLQAQAVDTSQLSQADQKLEQTEQQARQLRQEIAKLKEQINKTKIPSKTIRLPMQRDPGSLNFFYLLIQDDRFYPVDQEHCDYRFTSSTSFYALPRPGKGFSLTHLQVYLSRYNPKRHFVYFCVAENDQSFAAFQECRAITTENSFRYAVDTYAVDKGPLFSTQGGTTPKMQ